MTRVAAVGGHDQVAAWYGSGWAGTECGAKLPRERPAVDAGQAFELIHRVALRRVRGDAVANTQKTVGGKRAMLLRIIHRRVRQQIGHCDHQLGAGDIVQLRIEVPDF